MIIEGRGDVLGIAKVFLAEEVVVLGAEFEEQVGHGQGAKGNGGGGRGMSVMGK